MATLAVCSKSKTIANLHDTMADDCSYKKSRSTYNWFITKGKWDEDEVAQRKADQFFEALNLNQEIEFSSLSMTHMPRKKGIIPTEWENFSITAKVHPG